MRSVSLSRKSHLALMAVAGAGLALVACTRRSAEKRSLAELAISGTKSMLRTDADMQKVLNRYASFHPKAIEKIAPQEARRQPTIADAVNAVLRDEGRPVAPEALVPGVTAADCDIAGATGSLPARVYRPAGTGPFPVILFFHGGGWVFADRIVYDGGARGLAAEARAIVVSVDYRLAPEHPFPAAHEDALAAYRWVIDNAQSLGGDPERLALAGESAGGNLAMATAIVARNAGLAKPRHVLSVYPVTQSNTCTPSYERYADAIPLNRPMMLWFMAHATGTPDALQDPRLNLVSADLAGLPPVTLINAEIDPLRDDGALLERALRQAGVPVERRVYPGVTHEFFGTAAVVKKGREAQQYAGQRLAAAFAH